VLVWPTQCKKNVNDFRQRCAVFNLVHPPSFCIVLYQVLHCFLTSGHLYIQMRVVLHVNTLGDSPLVLTGLKELQMCMKPIFLLGTSFRVTLYFARKISSLCSCVVIILKHGILKVQRIEHSLERSK
jgi:hypothetical protein